MVELTKNFELTGDKEEAGKDKIAKRQQNKALYRLRQQFGKDPFGMMKQHREFHYLMTKSNQESDSADVDFIFCAYNLRKILNLIDRNVWKAWLKTILFH